MSGKSPPSHLPLAHGRRRPPPNPKCADNRFSAQKGKLRKSGFGLGINRAFTYL